MLTEEDLLLLKKRITEEPVVAVDSYVDDFRGQGLMYEVDAGWLIPQERFSC